MDEGTFARLFTTVLHARRTQRHLQRQSLKLSARLATTASRLNQACRRFVTGGGEAREAASARPWKVAHMGRE
jgi:hypothetical protein